MTDIIGLCSRFALQSRMKTAGLLAGAILGLTALFGTSTPAWAVPDVYTFSGACQSDCSYIGLNTGDGIGAVLEVAPGTTTLTASNVASIDLFLGNSTFFNTLDPVASGFDVTGTVAGSNLTSFQVALPTSGGGIDSLFRTPGPSSWGWEQSLSSLPLNQLGDGAWQKSQTAVYDFTGTCQDNCDFISLSPGDPVSATVQVLGTGERIAYFYDSVSLNFGNFGGLLDTTDPVGDGFDIASVVTASGMNSFFIADSGSANVFFTPGTGGFDWELSPSASPLAIRGNGQWSFREYVPFARGTQALNWIPPIPINWPPIGGGTGGSSGGTTTSVPEPASLALFGFGLAALGVLRRRRKA